MIARPAPRSQAAPAPAAVPPALAEPASPVAPPFADNSDLLATLVDLGNALLQDALTALHGTDQAESEAQAAGRQAHIASLRQALDARCTASLRTGRFIPWVHLITLFQPNQQEQTLLLLALLPEYDPRYHELLRWSADDAAVTAGASVSHAMALAALGGPARRFELLQALSDEAIPLRWRLIERLGDDAAAGGGYRLRPEIAGYLLGITVPRPQLAEPLPFIPAERTLAALPLTEPVRAQLDRLKQYDAETEPTAAFLLQWQGPDLALLAALAAAWFEQLNLHCLRLDGRHLAELARQRTRPILLGMLRGVCRDALLGNFVPVLFDCQWLSSDASTPDGAALLADVLAVLFESQRYVVVLNGPTMQLSDLALRHAAHPVTPLTIRVEAPDTRLRQSIWQQLCDEAGLSPAREDIVRLAEQYPFTEDEIRLSLRDALARQLLAPPPAVLTPLLFEACREQSRRKTLAVASEIQSSYQFDDLVLPPATEAAVRQVLVHARHRRRVIEEWQFDRNGDQAASLCVLFHGPSGTGKTMAASVLANDLQLGIYKIDLASVMSKYLGETEKHLAQLFDHAEAMNIVLFFDEAESLFAPRTDTRDAHDRYANLQTGYLLQRIERYPGIVILSTNLLKNIDKAFTRRFKFIVEFPFPGPAERRRLWQAAFPAAAPRADDIDLALLAEKARLTGGGISNIALTAAFQAAGEGSAIAMRHVLHATEREYAKLGKVFLADEFSWDDED
ncbi:ATP-binding protein [Chitinimonas arctica]|uniref:ATP-binding protein n=1 Tax=Chitinimonas arctica TaxID=2594795 RepID=A0A516SIL0_9NEIS|nr:ATP-binding protein [Chitinimonas arctica]QDQ27990.1 ATP-binding protein [Chitinimonas arctica]